MLDEGYCFASKHLPKGAENSYSGSCRCLFYVIFSIYKYNTCSFGFYVRSCADNLLNKLRAIVLLLRCSPAY